MSSTWNNKITFSIFGESHGQAIGVCMDNVPAGESIDIDEVYEFMARRAPKSNGLTTSRKEKDMPQIMSGFYNGKTTGTPLCAIIAITTTIRRTIQTSQSSHAPVMPTIRAL